MPCATAASCFTSGCLLISPFLPFPLGGSAGFCPTDFFLAFFIVTTLVLPILPTFASVQWPHSYALTGLSRVPASSSPALSSHPKAPPLASSEQPSSDWPCDPGSCSDQRAPGPRWRTPWLHRRRGSRAG